MKKSRYLAVLMAAVFSLSIGASAVFSKSYGMAGCGLGSVIVGPRGRFVQVFAATTNNIYYTNTTAMTSGTSNCVEDKGAFIKKQQEIFVTVNMSNLEQQMASGKGEKLRAFAGLLGCPASHVASFNKMTQQNYKSLATKTARLTPEHLLTSVKSSIAGNSKLAAACKYAI